MEFQMQATLSDFQHRFFYLLWKSHILKAYVILISLCLITCIVISNYGPESVETLADVAGIISFVALVAIPVGGLGIAKRCFKELSPPYSEYVYRIDETGLGYKTKDVELFVTWKCVRSVVETKRLLVIKLQWHRHYVFFRNRMSPELLASVREILRNAPVERKKMLPD